MWFFLTHEYAKRNERVIGARDGGKFTHSLAPQLMCKLFLVIPLTSAYGFRGKGTVDRRKKGHFQNAALLFCIWSPLMEHKNRYADLKWIFQQRHAF